MVFQFHWLLLFNIVIQVPYGRSELHLVEIMENLCDSMKHYAETTNKLGKKSLIRTITYSGEAVSLDDFKVNSELSEKLKYMVRNANIVLILLNFTKTYYWFDCLVCSTIHLRFISQSLFLIQGIFFFFCKIGSKLKVS